METPVDLDDARPDTATTAGTGPGRQPDPHDRARLEVSGTQVCASALASVSAAVIGSFFGVADTLVGAAVASIVATLGGAFYSLWIRRGSQRLKHVEVTRITALTRVGATTQATAPAPAGKDDDGEDHREPPRWWAWLAQRKRGALAGVAIVFLLTVGMITVIELVAQRPLAGVSDGDSSGLTSVGQVFRGSDSGSDSDTDEPATSTSTTAVTDPSSGGVTDTTPDGDATTSTESDSSGNPAPPPDGGTTTTTSGGSASTTTTATTATTAASSGGAGSPAPAEAPAG